MTSAQKADEIIARHPFTAQFLGHSNQRASDGLPQWWRSFRRSASQQLVGLDVPTTKDEDWRFVNLKPWLGREFQWKPSSPTEIDADLLASWRLPECEASTLVFVDGRFNAELSEMSGIDEAVEVVPFSGLDELDDAEAVQEYLSLSEFWEDDVFYQINGANFEDGAVILVPRNTEMETPIHLLFVATGGEELALHPRNIVVTGESAKVTVIEEHRGVEGVYFNNVVDQISLGANSKLRHIKVQRDSHQAFHMARNVITMGRDANYESTAINLGAGLSRNDAYARFEGTNIECTLDGLVYIGGKQVSDTHTVMDHALPDSTSYQLHKTIVDDRAHSVFNGKIFVRQDAQRIDSNQLNQNLLLSRRGRCDTKPQLEIFADDVVCSHGATVGQLQEEQLFYLMARGLEEDRARSLLTYAFAAEVLEDIEVASLRNRLEALLMAQTAGEE